MNGHFSNRMRSVITTSSQEEAARLKHGYVGTEHLLLGLIREGENNALIILESLGCDISKLKKHIELTINQHGTWSVVGDLSFTLQAERAINTTYIEAKVPRSYVRETVEYLRSSLDPSFHELKTINTEHLLLSILKHKKNLACKMLNESFSITHGMVHDELASLVAGEKLNREV